MFKVQVNCDCPGCPKTTTVANRSDELPKPWDAMGIFDTEYHGCCPLHLAAAVLIAIGFEEIARLMLENIKEPEREREREHEREHERTTPEAAP